MATARRRRGSQAVLGLQRSRDFFKSATRNINAVIFFIRIIAVLFLFLLMSRTWNSLTDETKQWDDFQLLIKIIVLFFFAFFLAILTIPALIAGPISSALAVPGLSSDYFNSARAFVLTNLFGEYDTAGFDKDKFLGSGDPLTPLAYILNKPTRNTYNTEALHGLILLLFILMFITGVGFVRRSSVNLAGLTLVISQVIIALAYMKGLAKDLPLNRDADGYISFGNMLDSPLFQLAFISYFYFEFSLQTGYLYSLANPALTRQKRVGKQLSKLSEFRLGVTKLGTDDEKAAEKAKQEKITTSNVENQTSKTSTALSTSSDSTSARKFGADALIFLLDSAQDSMFAKPGGEEERLTGRLQRYHDGLLAHDPKFDEKLGGSAGKAFNPFSVLLSLMLSMTIRVILLIVLAWMSINPGKVLEYIALPPTVTSSIEITQPEGILLVLIPIIFFLIGFSYMIARLQRIIVKAEELIISEAEIGKLLKAGKSIKSRKQVEERQAAQLAASAAVQSDQGGSQSSSPTKPTKKTRKRRVQRKK